MHKKYIILIFAIQKRNKLYFINNFNIDVMNDLKNLSEIRNLLVAHPFFTYDYADGLWINKDSKHISGNSSRTRNKMRT
ncbi:MAG: hypothetical protein [Bacteriophage sp.]|nr:MAG: hypothetical protein [Bacteriophage sp.]